MNGFYGSLLIGITFSFFFFSLPNVPTVYIALGLGFGSHPYLPSLIESHKVVPVLSLDAQCHHLRRFSPISRDSHFIGLECGLGISIF